MTTPPRDAAVPARASHHIGEYAGTARFDDLPDRPLGEVELMTLASSIAADPTRWDGEVEFDDEHRHYACLYRDDHVDVWVLCWTPRNDTGWHDHDISSGAVAVVRGELLEHNLAVGAPSIETVVPSGEVFSFGPSHIHRLTGHTPGAVSIHAYSPPLERMGQYDVDAYGVLRRQSVSYTEELRPLAVI
ncbi:cysteine dioxygenase family protein [Jatrophihabitans endophyticus]|uniref:cysteine dioxygenase n=1 Tax=Jatrophihabitans endophyticus TaxID=1206085 RepID=UPI0019FD5627|nr:cysteine dioxygenase family protein [Jatrophihabitans endophyticus]MBE7188273.1 cysteine dioxygenase [Jatrophihabitans endophyticus]